VGICRCFLGVKRGPLPLPRAYACHPGNLPARRGSLLTARHALHGASVARMPLPADRTSTAVRARPRSYGAVVTQLVTQTLDG
jgi:hypothetical protein